MTRMCDQNNKKMNIINTTHIIVMSRTVAMIVALLVSIAPLTNILFKVKHRVSPMAFV